MAKFVRPPQSSSKRCAVSGSGKSAIRETSGEVSGPKRNFFWRLIAMEVHFMQRRYLDHVLPNLLWLCRLRKHPGPDSLLANCRQKYLKLRALLCIDEF